MTKVVPIQETFSFQPHWRHDPAETLLKKIKLVSRLFILLDIPSQVKDTELAPILLNIFGSVKNTLQKCDDYDLACSINELVSLEGQLCYSRPSLHVDIGSAARQASASDASQTKSPQYAEESGHQSESSMDGSNGVSRASGGGSGSGDGGSGDERGSLEGGGSEDDELWIDLTSLHRCHLDVDKIVRLNGSAVDSLTLNNCSDCALAVMLLEHPSQCQALIKNCTSCKDALGLVIDHAVNRHECSSLVCSAVKNIQRKHDSNQVYIKVRNLIVQMFRRSQKRSDGTIPVVVENFTSPEPSLGFVVFSLPVVTHERPVKVAKTKRLPLSLRSDPVIYGEPRQLKKLLRKWDQMKTEIELTGVLPNVISEGVIFDCEKLTISHGQYRCNKEWKRAKHIGSGNFGSVYIATDCDTEAVFCVKQVPLVKFHSNEVEIHSSLDHPHIAKMLGAISSEDNNIYIFIQYIEGCNLLEMINHNIQLDSWFTLRFIKQLLFAIIYLREKQILHEDLKAENLIIDMQTYTLYVIDFGLAQRVHPPDFDVKPYEEACGTPITWSPEKVKSEGYDVRSAVWEVGCITIHCLKGRAPWMETTFGIHQVMMAIAERPPPVNELPPNLPDAIEDLVQLALKKDPRQRPMPEDLIKHSAFALLDEDPSDEKFFAHINDEDGNEDCLSNNEENNDGGGDGDDDRRGDGDGNDDGRGCGDGYDDRREGGDGDDDRKVNGDGDDDRREGADGYDDRKGGGSSPNKSLPTLSMPSEPFASFSVSQEEAASDTSLNVSLHSDEHMVIAPEDLVEEARTPQDSDLIGIQSHLNDASVRLVPPLTLQRPHSLTHDPYTPPQHQMDPWVNNNQARIITHRNEEYFVCGPPSDQFTPPPQPNPLFTRPPATSDVPDLSIFAQTLVGSDVPDLPIFNSGSSYVTVIHNPVEPVVLRDQRIEFRWFETPEDCLTSFRLQVASTWGAVVLSVAPQIHLQLPAFTAVDGNENALDLNADIQDSGDIVVFVKNASYPPYRWRVRQGELDIM